MRFNRLLDIYPTAITESNQMPAETKRARSMPTFKPRCNPSQSKDATKNSAAALSNANLATLNSATMHGLDTKVR